MPTMNAPRTAFGIVDVLDDPAAMGARNAISAPREIFECTGLVKKEQVEVSGNTSSLFILPPKTAKDDLAE